MGVNTTMTSITENPTATAARIKELVDQKILPLSGATVAVVRDDAASADADVEVFTVTITDPANDDI